MSSKWFNFTHKIECKKGIIALQIYSNLNEKVVKNMSVKQTPLCTPLGFGGIKTWDTKHTTQICGTFDCDGNISGRGENRHPIRRNFSAADSERAEHCLSMGVAFHPSFFGRGHVQSLQKSSQPPPVATFEYMQNLHNSPPPRKLSRDIFGQTRIPLTTSGGELRSGGAP